MKFIKPAVVLLSLISIAIIILSFFTARSTPNKSIPSFGERLVSINKPNKLTSLEPDLKAFTKENKLNEKLCFLIDMSKASGTRRFYVFDLETASVKDAGLITHGWCNEEWMEGRKYSNAIGSGCTSLGGIKWAIPMAGNLD